MKTSEIRTALRKVSNKKQATLLQGFFKTGPGEYGEGDVFIGVKVPEIRKLAQRCNATPLRSVLSLLKSRIHEERLLALLILVRRFQTGTHAEQKDIYKTYLAHTAYVNNWDLVDLTAHHIVGAYLQKRSRAPLTRLATSSSLWERRIAVIATFAFIRDNDYDDCLRIATQLLHDKEDLIHKAVGWMLREAGKRDMATEEAFLKRHYRTMPRTMLRYAIERFPERKRQAYLKGTIR